MREADENVQHLDIFSGFYPKPEDHPLALKLSEPKSFNSKNNSGNINNNLEITREVPQNDFLVRMAGQN